MNGQATLFGSEGSGRVRANDPVTSVSAARAQRGGAEQTILDVLAVHGPMHADAICALRPTIFAPTLKTALSRLVSRDLVEWDGTYADSDRGHPQQVWKLK